MFYRCWTAVPWLRLNCLSGLQRESTAALFLLWQRIHKPSRHEYLTDRAQHGQKYMDGFQLDIDLALGKRQRFTRPGASAPVAPSPTCTQPRSTKRRSGSC
jgi:hypothetical protein